MHFVESNNFLSLQSPPSERGNGEIEFENLEMKFLKNKVKVRLIFQKISREPKVGEKLQKNYV